MKRLWAGILILMIALMFCAYARAETGSAGTAEQLWASWDEVTLTEAGDSYVARLGGLYAILDMNGNVLYEADGPEGVLLTAFQGFGPAGWAPVWTGEKQIALSRDGTLRLPDTFDFISERSDISGMHTFRQNGRTGIISAGGSILFEAIFDEADISADAIIYTVCQDGKWGYVTFTGEYLTELRFEAAYPFRGEYALVKENGKYGYINRDGAYFIENTLAEAGEFNGGYAIISPSRNNTSVINAEGTYILKPYYASVTRLAGLNAIKAWRDNKYVLLNLYPEYVLEAGIPSADYPFEAPYRAVCTDVDSYVVADANGRVLLGPAYRISIQADGVAEVIPDANSDAVYYTFDDVGNAFQVQTVSSGFVSSDFYPNEGKKVVAAMSEPSLNKRASKKHRLPHVNGDERLLPLFSALVQATYPDDTRYTDEHISSDPLFTASDSRYSMKQLSAGHADMLFLRGNAEEILADAKAAGVDAQLTPIAMEALVFIANARNPIENVTVSQIEAIYSGEITDWSELGVAGTGSVTAYQCASSSAAQEWFESAFDNGDKSAAAAGPQYSGAQTKGLQYRNLTGAFGYSERFFCTDLLGNEIRFLSVNGAFPSEKNIRSGTYPYAVTVYAVTRKGDDNPNTAAFLKWIQSDEAMELVQRSGFVPIRKINDMDTVIEQLCKSAENRLNSEKTADLRPQCIGNLYGYINAFGDLVIPAHFDSAHAFEGNFAIVANSDYYHGIINRQGVYVIPPLYFDISTESDDGVVICSTTEGSEHYFILEDNTARRITGVSAALDMNDYMPNKGRLVATLDDEPTLDKRISQEYRLPRTDGATALFPVYSAFVQATYPDDTRYGFVTTENKTPLITCTRTNEAYERLINGDADIIFVAEPSDAQVAGAAAKGVEFELTPFGKEAFVFIVNRSNPLENITIDQIRAIYSGKTTKWKDLKISGLGDIMAYQRPENSGSQTALQKLMGDVPLMKAPEAVVAWDMGDIIDTIEYRNLPNAIGYTFRFFCSELTDNDVKMLSVNGVAPTIGNIRSGDYPITSTLYAVTRKGDDNPNTAAFLEWIQSSQGMELVEKSGYVPWYEPEIDLGTFDDPA